MRLSFHQRFSMFYIVCPINLIQTFEFFGIKFLIILNFIICHSSLIGFIFFLKILIINKDIVSHKSNLAEYITSLISFFTFSFYVMNQKTMSLISLLSSFYNLHTCLSFSFISSNLRGVPYIYCSTWSTWIKFDRPHLIYDFPVIFYP